MRPLTLDEQETCFSILATDRSAVYVYSGDPVWQNRLKRAGVEPYEVGEDGGKFYKLDSRQLRIRSMAQVEAASERAKQQFRGFGVADGSEDAAS